MSDSLFCLCPAQAAAQRYLDFHVGMYADPLYYGNYSTSVLEANIPELALNETEKALIKGSNDYFGVIYYTGY